MLARIRKSLPVHPTMRHPHTGEPLVAVGLRLDGRPIWPIMGASEDDDQGDDGGDDKTGDDDQGDDGDDDITDDEKKALGDPGKQAIDRMKAREKAERDRRKALEQELAQLRSGKDGDKPDPDKIRADARREVEAELTRERVTDKIEARAGKLFADPDDAAALLLRSHDIDDFLDGNGKIDVEAIQDALTELLDKKPYLGIAQGDEKGKRFKGGADGGTRKESRAGQLTREDLKGMTPQQIAKAKAEGRLADALSGKA